MKTLIRSLTRRLVKCKACGELVPDNHFCDQCGASYSTHQEYVTYCAAKAGSFALALPATRRASEQYGAVTSALSEQALTAIEHMRDAYDQIDFTQRWITRWNRQSILKVHRNCNPLANQLRAFVQNNCTID